MGTVFMDTYDACMAWALRENGNVPLKEAHGLWRGRFSARGDKYEIVINPHETECNRVPPLMIHVYPVTDIGVSRFSILSMSPRGEVSSRGFYGPRFDRDIRKEMKAEEV